MPLLADWNIYRNNAGMSAVIHTGVNVLYGSGSLELRYATGGSQVNLTRVQTPKRFTSGRARFLFGRSDSNNIDNPGFAFMLSQEDITGAAGAAYLVAISRPGPMLSPRLYRCSAGLGTKNLLFTGTNMTLVAAPQAYPIEVTWRLDAENLGGMSIIMKRGAAADYRGLSLQWDTLLTTTEINYLDTSGYLTVSQGEGPALEVGGTNTGGNYFDEMTVVPLLIGGITT
jgi:hypothetical protein